MSEADFDVDRLAAYLHLTPPEVAKMADRGQLPGRRIGGEWRFSPAEIHHWLERRTGEGDESLTGVEQVLERSHGSAADVSLADMTPLEAIAIPLAARTREKVMRAMIDAAAASGMLWDPDKMLDAVRARESLHTTAMENGVALLHSRRPMPTILEQPFVALGVTSSGVPFGNARGILTDVYFLILSTEDAGHLGALARISRLIMEPDFLAALRAASSAREAHDAIREFERKLDE